MSTELKAVTEVSVENRDRYDTGYHTAKGVFEAALMFVLKLIGLLVAVIVVLIFIGKA
ncbi:MAG: hypothetical protein GY861_24255 [bacterium]|nr:hypothetical protein [bacterium]